MKRRSQRRPVLDINGEQSESPRGGRWQNKYQQIAVDHPEQNGTSNNPLASLLVQYNSDSEAEDGKQDTSKLNDKVNDFLKEIQMIAPHTAESSKIPEVTEKTILTQRVSSEADQRETGSSLWQECFDETTGYPYYWHIETNQVTWEKPSELKIKEGGQGDTNNQVQTKPHAHPAHTQLPWANFLPNTYPEMQTDIPEGMIPKEVVARNRNRQVGVVRGHQQESEVITTVPKNTRPKEDDSDDEKIEMITSFGNDESESDTSDNELVVSKVRVEKSTHQRVAKSHTNSAFDKHSKADVTDGISIGPSLPPGIIPMIHGPENANIDAREVSENSRVRVQSMRRNSNTPDQNALSEDAPRQSDEIDEEDILKRLRNQANLLQALGGEVPKSVETLISNDIVSENGAISTSANAVLTNLKNSVRWRDSGMKNLTPDRDKENEDTNRHNQIKISLVAGYSDDSDLEEETSPKTDVPPLQPLFPISGYIGTDGSNSNAVQSSPYQICETPAIDGGSNISGTRELKSSYSEGDEKTLTEDSQRTDNTGRTEGGVPTTSVNDEVRTFGSENELPKQNTFLENLEMPAKGFQRKKRIAFDVVPNKTSRQPDPVQIQKMESSTLTSSNIRSCEDTERHGFGFHKEQEHQSVLENGDSSDMTKEMSDKQSRGSSVSQLSKSISFVKGETSNFRTAEETPKPVEKPVEVDHKQLKEMTDIVMEKIKFLSEGSQNLSAIQIMVIQLQTLCGAWEAGELKEGYLFEWLKGTGLELARLEQAAAPPGWDCHWDRLHKRYYYRNATTGEAQWTYPEADVVGGTEEMDLCTTPPPPDDVELEAIDERSRPKLDSASMMSLQESPTKSLTAEGHNKIIQITKDEYKSLEAPPPPQISSPSPPPPPRIFAEDLKKGKKRRGSGSDGNGELKKDKIDSAPPSDAKERVDALPPLPPAPSSDLSQPPLPPNPPCSTHTPNPPNGEPLPPGVDPKDMPYTLPVTTMEPGAVIYNAGSAQRTNPIYAATIGNRGIATLPIIDHRSAIIQGQLMHYPAYQHLHNQAMIAAAGSLAGQESVQFMITDYAQIYANTQVIAKPPIKSQNESLGSALDSFYNDIASIEKTNAEQDSNGFETPGETTPPPPIPTIPNTATSHTEVDQVNVSSDPAVKEKDKEKEKEKEKERDKKKRKFYFSLLYADENRNWKKAKGDVDNGGKVATSTTRLWWQRIALTDSIVTQCLCPGQW
ncbi:formin-binding protein 4-like isoform X2 [Athalia rosae]|uniref:formin-binding protein 4-like isoform X2 n=1 Tax=Athalia rosae TaxID=37344 RepID=UPI0020344AF6|nr:formin-binding protein 4-like isoform X2 [Athalia rosae]